MEIKQRLNNVFEWFNSLGTAREDFTQFKDIFTSDSSGSNNITSFVSQVHCRDGINWYYMVLVQVLESICDPARPELPDIRNHSQEGLSNILRSGFRFETCTNYMYVLYYLTIIVIAVYS